MSKLHYFKAPIFFGNSNTTEKLIRKFGISARYFIYRISDAQLQFYNENGEDSGVLLDDAADYLSELSLNGEILPQVLQILEAAGWVFSDGEKVWCTYISSDIERHLRTCKINSEKGKLAHKKINEAGALATAGRPAVDRSSSSLSISSSLSSSNSLTLIEKGKSEGEKLTTTPEEADRAIEEAFATVQAPVPERPPKKPKPKREKLAPADALTMDLPTGLDTPEVRDALSAWIDHKRKIGSAYYSRDQLHRALLALGSILPGQLVESIGFSIGSGYRGIYAPKRELKKTEAYDPHKALREKFLAEEKQNLKKLEVPND